MLPEPERAPQKPAEPTPAPRVEATPAPVKEAAPQPAVAQPAPVKKEAAAQPASPPVQKIAPAPQKKGGLFGWLFNKRIRGGASH
jgi:hypothetical protein